MNGKQIEFPPKQTHVRSFELAMLAISHHLRDRRADHRPGHRPRRRVPPDRLSGADYTRGVSSLERRGRRTAEPRHRTRRAPTWPRFAVVVAVLVLAFVISRTSELGGRPRRRPSRWPPSRSISCPRTPRSACCVRGSTVIRSGSSRSRSRAPTAQTYDELAVVRIDAETGEVVEFREQKDTPRGPDEAP